MPQQFIKLFDDNSLFQLTINRNKSTEQYFLAVDQFKELHQSENKFLDVIAFLQESQKYSPAIYEALKIAYENTKLGKDMIRNIEDDSIDYAIMGKSYKVKVVLLI